MTDQLSELINSVKKMRDAQRRYYAHPSKPNLITAKNTEQKVDECIKEIELAKQPQQSLTL